MLTTPVYLWAEKTSPGWSIVRVVLDRFAVSVAVVTGVDQYVTCSPGQLGYFLRKRPIRVPIRGIGRGQKGPNSAVLLGRDHNFVAVAENPAMVTRMGPGSFPISAFRKAGSR
jgi:hypothetical protein